MKLFVIIFCFWGVLTLTACGSPRSVRTALPEGSQCSVSGYDRQMTGRYNDGVRRHELVIEQFERTRHCYGVLVVREGQFVSPYAPQPERAPTEGVFTQGGSLLGEEAPRATQEEGEE